MKWWVWTLACCLALLMSGCAKRQNGVRLVYVAAPPFATSAPPDSGTLVIQQPVTPGPEELPLTEPAELLNTPLPIPPSQKKVNAASSAPADSSPEELLVEPPPLEPANSPGQGRRQQLEKRQHEMDSSIKQFVASQLSNPERQTLGEAKAFLDQSKAALGEGDLPRAEKLAEKARLLIAALEQRH